MSNFQRSFPLLDYTVRSDGGGRVVEAYAAVWNNPTEIRDNQGHYREQIAPHAFNKTVSDKGTRFGVFFNHGRTLMGTPSDRYSMPVGVPVEPPRPDDKGLVTVTRYAETDLGDEVLELWRVGAISGQSFSGRWTDSEPVTPRGGYRASRSGDLPLVTRNGVTMDEYGPTPIPAYDVPMLIAQRAATGRWDSALVLGYLSAIDAVVDRALESLSNLMEA